MTSMTYPTNAAELLASNYLWLPAMVAVDPERFKRTHGLFTLKEALALPTIPAPDDYFQRLKMKCQL